jgi:hypothetical protein
MSENTYELARYLACYGPTSTTWIHSGSSFKMLKVQVNRLFIYFAYIQRMMRKSFFVLDMLL